ncbi:MAG: hypothetical protein NTW54_10150 [Bacteroidetes bacterium]|nr:hypothetical protein [Bacteroidota bacterium]
MKSPLLVLAANCNNGTKSKTQKNVTSNISMKLKLSIILILSLISSLTYAQQNPCSLIPNGTFASNNYSKSDPIVNGTVNGWAASHGSPALNSVSPLSDSASPEILAGTNAFISDIGSGIRTKNKITFIQGKRYYIVFNYRNNNGVNAQELNVALVADAVWGTTGNTLPLSGLTNITQLGSRIAVAGSVSTWTKRTICFTAPYTSADLWFYAKVASTATLSSRIGIDNVEIFQDFDFAGTPKVRFTCDQSATIGTVPCSQLNTPPSYTWYISGTSTIVASTSSLEVLPNVTTTYLVVRNNGECISSDTIRVVVSHIPRFTLGNDTTICQCENFVLDPGIRNACFSYTWKDGYVGASRKINENSKTALNSLSQTYTLTITDNCSGCSYTQSIVVSFKPVPNCKPRTKIFCEGEFPQTITTKGIGTSYTWSWNAAVAPTLPLNGKSLIINSIGQYVCMVTDANANCTYGYDTINVHPWDSMLLKIVSNRNINPCSREGIYLMNAYDADLENTIKWYKDGVYLITSPYLRTAENGLYTVEMLSPLGSCLKRDTFKLTYIDPPIINLAPVYGSFCRNTCDTILSFTYCDTCGKDMGTVTSIKWSGKGVSTRKVGGIDQYFFCAQTANCGNNILTATVVYTKYGIICTTSVNTNAYKVCPLQLDNINPLCASDGDVSILNQGNLITNAQIYGTAVYQEAGTNYFKFSPRLAGPGVHTIRYYFSDSAGCSGWDSIQVKVYGKPTIKLWVGDCISGTPTWNVLVYAAHAEADTYHLQSSEWSGSSNFNIGQNADYAKCSFWGSTKSPSIAGHTYWFKVTNGNGCGDSVGITVGQEKPIHLTYSTTDCITKGVALTAYYNSTLVDGHTYPATIAYIWDNNDTTMISTLNGSDKDYASMMNTIKGSSVFGALQLKHSPAATHKVFTTGWHKIRVLTIGGCEYMDSVLIPFDCSNCAPEVENIIITSNVKWENEERIINGNIIIEAGGNLELNNCNLHFTASSRIIVKNNYGATHFSGTLSIINSTLDGCKSWKGIEVWGSPDLYDWNGMNIELGDDPRTKLMGSNVRESNGVNATHSWAWVYASNSTIKDADIAILIGKYDDQDDRNYSLENVSGGMAFVNNCLFKNNYVDVVFTPRPGAELISGRQSWNASYIVKTTFDSIRKVSPNGSKMYWCDENGKSNPMGTTITNQNPEGHIVDLTETLYQDLVSPLVFYAFTGKSFNPVTGGMNMVNTTLKRDLRIPYTLPHQAYLANPIPKHLGVYSITQISARFKNTISNNTRNDW